MKWAICVVFLGLLGAACGSPTAVPSLVDTASPTFAVASATPSPLPPTPSPLPPTPTPLPPTPTPTPTSRVIGPDNFTEVSPVQDYEHIINELVTEQYQVVGREWRIDMSTYSPDGRYLAVGGCTSLVSGHQGAALCYHPVDGGHVFLYVLDAETTELVYTLPDEAVEITGLSFSPDGTLLAYAVCPLQLRLVDLETMQAEQTLWSGRGCDSYPKVAISPDGEQAALVVDTRLLVFDLTTGMQITEQPAQRLGSVLPKYSQDGARLAVFGEEGGAVFIYDTATWQRVTRIRVGDVIPDAVDFSADGRWVVTAGEDTGILLWDAITSEQIATLDERLTVVGGLSFTPDGRLLLAGVEHAYGEEWVQMAVWNPASRERLGALYGKEETGRIIFARDGESFMASLSRWSLPDAGMAAARQAVTTLFTALADGDFQTAAELWLPDPSELSSLEALGIDWMDLPGALQALCARPTAPCMPVQEIVFSGPSRPYGDAYLVWLHFRRPDGSLFQTGDGERTFWVTVMRQPDGRWQAYFPDFFLHPEE